MSEARKLTALLQGNWHGRYGTSSCPVCQPEGRSDQNALTLTDGSRGLLLDCKKSRCRFLDVLAAAKIVPQRKHKFILPSSCPRPNTATSDHAKKVWEASQPIKGTLAEVYLRDVRMADPSQAHSLRFNARTWHGSVRQNLPALIACIEDANGFAISRTYLRSDGSGKADLAGHEQRLMLGSAAGGHVALKPASDPLIVAEGIETALSLPLLDMVGGGGLWATLSASNMRSLRLPGNPGQLVIATDGDETGRSAGDALACKARGLGWDVVIKPAPDGFDWNDVLVERLATAGGCKHVV